MSPETIRALPHSLEVEEYLLSNCVAEEVSAEVLAKCEIAGITRHSFYLEAHAIIYDRLVAIWKRGDPVDLAVLAEELKAEKKLEAVGNYSGLLQLKGRVPTTVQADYFIEKVREQHLLRELIKSATRTVEQCHNFEPGPHRTIDEFVAELQRGMLPAASVQNAGREMPLDALLAFDKKADPDCLMGNRFLGRTSGCVIVAPSGVGKSVLSLQFGACAALARPFFGLRMASAMRVLYIQAEDDLGDVAEAVQGFIEGYAVSKAEMSELSARLRIVRWNDAAGDKFLSRLRSEHVKWPFDLVIINPLFSFCGCNVSEQRDMSSFLRNGLNPILNYTRAAAIIVHHTNKPPTDPRSQPSDVNADLRYLGSGSAELTNWARAYITLQGVRSAGDKVHKMVFAKRGHRAGIVDEEGKPTTSVLIEHSQGGLCWVPSGYRPEKDTGGKFKPKFDQQRALVVYDRNLGWSENERRIAEDQGMTSRAVRGHRHALEAVA